MSRRFQFSLRWLLCVTVGAASGASSLAFFIRSSNAKATIAEWAAEWTFPLLVCGLVGWGSGLLVWIVTSE
ncbi:MAG TPA: hypothetical protein VG125_03980 [Pirellulales bacterium]|nr:hypothetical protein [Pirellulales bacterium]